MTVIPPQQYCSPSSVVMTQLPSCSVSTCGSQLHSGCSSQPAERLVPWCVYPGSDKPTRLSAQRPAATRARRSSARCVARKSTRPAEALSPCACLAVGSGHSVEAVRAQLGHRRWDGSGATVGLL